MPNYGLGEWPYPAASVAPDVPADMLTLVQRISALVDPPATVGALPAAGQYTGHVLGVVADPGALYFWTGAAWVRYGPSFVVVNLTDLDAITGAQIGDRAFMTTPGTGIDALWWVAYSGSGATIDWRPEGMVIAATKANLDSFVSAVAAISDTRFEIGGLANVTGTGTIYRFTSLVGAYLFATSHPTAADLTALDAIATAAIGDRVFVTAPGTGIDGMWWIAYAGTGSGLDWRPEGMVIAATKANLDTFIAAVAAIADTRFEVGGLASVTGTNVLYRFTSTVGAYLFATSHPIVTDLTALDAVATATIGDRAYMTAPGTGINGMWWVAYAGSGSTIDWHPDEMVIADTKAHLDTFIAAVAAITDTRFVVGAYAYVTGTTVLYKFTSTAGAIVEWESEWITYNATLTNFVIGTGGSALNSTKYKYVNGQVLVEYSFIFGTSGQTFPSSFPIFTLPVNSQAAPARFAAYMGNSSVVDASVPSAYNTFCSYDDTTATRARIYRPDYVVMSTILPMTWAAGDGLQGSLLYTPA